MNLQRRHLTKQQLAMLAADPDILDALEAEARERQTRGVQAKMPEGSQSRDEAAKTFQTSARYVQDAKKIRKQKPELVEPVINGTQPLTQNYQTLFCASGEVPRLSCDPVGVSLVKHRSCS
jgi:hypothetical protein